MSVRTEEGTHTLADGRQLYTKTWKPSTEARARILFIHGFSDHCNNYEFFFTKLAESGIEVYSFDQRGWGRSVKRRSDRGLTGPTTLVLSDITSMAQTLLPSPIPFFLMGHSMGGAETLFYASRGPPEILSQIRGFIASAPLVALHPDTKPWHITVVLGRLAGKLLPKRQLVNRLDSKWLSHDEELNKQWEADELNHDTGTLEGLAGMLDRAAELDGGRVLVNEGVGEGGKTRLLVTHGTDDHINDFEASKRFVERCRVGDKTLLPYKGLYHNVHAEAGDSKAKFASDIIGWISDRLDPSSSVAQPKL